MAKKSNILLPSPPGELNSNYQASESNLCRICYQNRKSSNLIITPCKCKGSIKTIHEDCLKQWILTQVKNPLDFKCDLCKSPVKMKLNSIIVFSCEELKNHITIILIYKVLLVMVSSFVVFSLNFLINSGNDDEITLYMKIYLSFIIILSVFGCGFLIWILVDVVKKGCFKRKILEWKILSDLDDRGVEVKCDGIQKSKEMGENGIAHDKTFGEVDRNDTECGFVYSGEGENNNIIK